jgi:hypothetical protein
MTTTVILKKEHTHAGVKMQSGDPLTISESTAQWLVDNDVATKKVNQTTAKPVSGSKGTGSPVISGNEQGD